MGSHSMPPDGRPPAQPSTWPSPDAQPYPAPPAYQYPAAPPVDYPQYSSGYQYPAPQPVEYQFPAAPPGAYQYPAPAPYYQPNPPPPMYYGYQAPPVPRTSRVPAWLVLAAAIAVGIGTLLPWVKANVLFFSVTVDGTSTDDGKLFLGVAIVCAIVAAFIALINATKWLAVLTLLGGGLAGIGGAVDLADVSRLAGNAPDAAVVQVGIGLYICVAAGFLLLAMSIVVLVRPQR